MRQHLTALVLHTLIPHNSSYLMLIKSVPGRKNESPDLEQWLKFLQNKCWNSVQSPQASWAMNSPSGDRNYFALPNKWGTHCRVMVDSARGKVPKNGCHFCISHTHIQERLVRMPTLQFSQRVFLLCSVGKQSEDHVILGVLSSFPVSFSRKLTIFSLSSNTMYTNTCDCTPPFYFMREC